MNEHVELMKKTVSKTPEHFQKNMLKKIVTDCPYYMKKIKDNIMTEKEVIKLIKDINLSDRQVLKICQFLRTKWGKESITPNISKKLIKRKKFWIIFLQKDVWIQNRNITSKTKWECLCQG